VEKVANSSGAPTGKWVLIVEDDESISGGIRMALQLEQYSSLVARNGAIALQKLESGNMPSLVFLDLMMPIMDGEQFLAELGKATAFSKIPVVIVTAAPEKANKIIGAVGILKKPIDIDSLLNFAKQYCG
jgi:DNA-binding response OmpR family regulator